VRSTNGQPAIGAIVVLLEVTLRRLQVLGEAVTNADGVGLIDYDPSALFMPSPDLRVVVLDSNATPLLESREAVVTVPAAHVKVAAASAGLSAMLARQGVPSGVGARLTPEEARYIAERSGVPLSSVLSRIAADNLAPELAVPRDLVFALLESQAPGLDGKLRDAAERGLLGNGFANPSPRLREHLDRALKQRAARTDLGRGSLEGFWATQVTDPAVRAEVAGLLLDTQHRAVVRRSLEERELATPEVRFLLDLQTIVGVDEGAATALRDRFRDGTLRAGPDLAMLSVEEWQHVLGDDADNADRARLVRRRAQHLFPERAFRAQLERHRGATWATEAERYFERYPDRTFRSALPAPSDQLDESEAAELASISTYAQVFDLAQDHDAVGELLKSDLLSAPDIAGISEIEFVGRHLTAFGGDERAARETHARAVTKSAALNYAASFLPIGRRPSLCACADCKSIFGPAAYLFELLAMFQRYTAQGGQSLLWHLEQRRPDCTRVHLSCPNTTIEVPQIDLVNEILEDLILGREGGSVVHNLGTGECLPLERQSQGASEERRASPQHEPNADLVQQLATATFPWTLPYDYHRDRAHSARTRLLTDPEKVAFMVWRWRSAGDGASFEAATGELALATLNLSDLQARLITTPSSVEEGWGRDVGLRRAADRVPLRMLRQVAGTDFEMVEAVLSSRFVRGFSPSDVSILPPDFCATGQDPELVGPPQTLETWLDRYRRFERLRRRLDWSVRDLDRALHWLEGDLDALRLEQIGVLKFLQARLRVEPAVLLTLFADPSLASQQPLRGPAAPSDFEHQFGQRQSHFERPDLGLPSDARAQLVVAQIARVAGESADTVNLAFRIGIVDGAASSADILAMGDSDAGAAFARAVSATWRLARWARMLRLDEPSLVNLIDLGNLRVLSPGSAAPDKLADALRLLDLAESRSRWPVAVTDLRYLTRAPSDADEPRVARTPSQIGASLSELRARVQAIPAQDNQASPNPRAALRQALATLLVPGNADARSSDSDSALAEEVASDFEWSAFFVSRGARAEAFMHASVRDWAGGSPPGSPHTADLTAALGEVGSLLNDWLAEAVGGTQPWGTPELSAMREALTSAIEARLGDPTSDQSTLVASALSALLTDAGESRTADVVARLAQALVQRAHGMVEQSLSSLLTERAAEVLSPVERTIRRNMARVVVAEWLTEFTGAPLALATALLDHLEDPDRPAQAIIDAFIDEFGAASARLEASQVQATYHDPGGAGAEAVLSRPEAGLTFDWSLNPPTSGLATRPFRAVLEVSVPRASLMTADGTMVNLVVEADGRFDVEVEDSGSRRPLLQTAESSDGVRRVVAAVGALSDTAVTLHIDYTTPNSGGARRLRVLSQAPGRDPAGTRLGGLERQRATAGAACVGASPLYRGACAVCAAPRGLASARGRSRPPRRRSTAGRMARSVRPPGASGSTQNRRGSCRVATTPPRRRGPARRRGPCGAGAGRRSHRCALAHGRQRPACRRGRSTRRYAPAEAHGGAGHGGGGAPAPAAGAATCPVVPHRCAGGL
jgi:hypothetical protein